MTTFAASFVYSKLDFPISKQLQTSFLFGENIVLYFSFYLYLYSKEFLFSLNRLVNAFYFSNIFIRMKHNLFSKLLLAAAITSSS